MKRLLVRLYWLFASQLGFNPRMFLRSLQGIPRYIKDSFEFRKNYTGALIYKPCLYDRYEEGGITKSEYFWQDLLVARMIFEAKPRRHVDIGSRIDGFVAHVASFRDIEVFDVRPISTRIPGVVFKQADLMRDDSLPDAGDRGYCDSLSCLHALEHFGLGRYGDPVDPQGYVRGIANMAKLLQPGGTFYLSTPIGRERVEFNANWVFNPHRIIQLAESQGLTLLQLTIVGTDGPVRDAISSSEKLETLAGAIYNLCLCVFTKSQRTVMK